MTRLRRMAYLLIAHGTREEEGRAAFFRFVDEFRRAFPDRQVEPAFLELIGPSIPEGIEACVKEGAEEVLVLPLMLFPGRHINKDIPDQIQSAKRKYPQVDFHYAGALAVNPRHSKPSSEPKMFELLLTKIAHLED